MSEFLPGILAVAAVVVAVTVYFSSPLFGPLTVQAVTEQGQDADVSNLFEPLHQFQYRYVQAHHTLPEWIDAVGLGTPAVDIGTTSNAYLPRLAALDIARSAETAADVLAWLEAIVGALAVTALARRYGLSWGAASVAGVSYPLAHTVVRWMPYFSVPVFHAALPLVVLGLELVWARRFITGGAVAIAGLGVGGIGGSVLFTQLAVQVAALVALYRLVVTSVPARERLTRVAVSVVAIGVGIAAASPGWLPFALAQGNTVRTSTTFALIPPVTWATLRSVLTPTARHTTIGINGDLYVSLLAPVLIVVGLVRSLRSRLLGFVPVYAAVLLLIGLKTPLLRLLIAGVPGWAYVSSVERYVAFLAVLPLVLLMAIGVDLLLRHGSAGIAVLAGVTGLQVAVWWIAMHRAQAVSFVPVIVGLIAVVALAAAAHWYSRLGGQVVSIMAGIALVSVGVSGSLGERRLGWQPVRDQADPQYRPWLELVGRNNDSAGRWMSYCQRLTFWTDPKASFTYRPATFLDVPGRWLDTYVSFPSPDYYAYWHRLTGSNLYTGREFGAWFQHTPDAGAPNSGLVDAAGITRVLGSSACRRPLPESWRRLASVRAVPTSLTDTVYVNTQAFPQAYVSHRWRRAVSRDAAVDAIAAEHGLRFGSHVDWVEAATPAAPGGDPLPVTLRRVSGTDLEVDFGRPLTRAGLLVVLDRFDSNWHAYVDGEKTRIVRTNGVFRGVAVPRGSRSAVLRYEPWWNSTLYPVSWTLICLSFVAIAWTTVSQMTRRL